MCNECCFSKVNKAGGVVVNFREKTKRTLLLMVERIAKNEIDVDIYQWPPNCSSLLHQPERPTNGEEVED